MIDMRVCNPDHMAEVMLGRATRPWRPLLIAALLATIASLVQCQKRPNIVLVLTVIELGYGSLIVLSRFSGGEGASLRAPARPHPRPAPCPARCNLTPSPLRSTYICYEPDAHQTAVVSNAHNVCIKPCRYPTRHHHLRSPIRTHVARQFATMSQTHAFCPPLPSIRTTKTCCSTARTRTSCPTSTA